MEFLKKVGMVGVVSATLIGASLGLSSKTSADFDLAGLNTQVQQQQVQLDNVSAKVDNHEQRITNLENNATPTTQPVQPATPVAPATPVSAPVMAPTTKTVTKSWWNHQNLAGFGDTLPQDNWFCNYEYSDGTSDFVAVAAPVDGAVTPTCLPIGTVVN